MTNIIKRFTTAISVSAVVGAIMLVALTASAATITVGNDSGSRTQLDTNSNFVVVDTNHPVSAAGDITQFNYFASNTNPFSFVIVDASNVVQFVSTSITPVVGANTFTLTTPFPVQAGWNIGAYFSSTGTIPFEVTGATGWATVNGSGSPTIGNTLSVTSVGARTYSFMGTGIATIVPTGFFVGNDNAVRTQLDTNSNFTVVDTNHPITSTGMISEFDYYAANTNPFAFVLVDGSNVVQYVSPMITPVVGMNTFTPTSAVPVQAGWNIGAYFSLTGTIPFEVTGATGWATASGTGMPTVTSTLPVANVGARMYSFVGLGTATTVTPILISVGVLPATPTINVTGTQQLTASPMDQNSVAFVGATITYSSDNTAVATVDTNGLVTGVVAGSATITVTATSGTTVVTGTSVVTVSSTTTGGTPFLPPRIATPDVSFYVGNDALTAGSTTDTYSNFTVVDTNNPAPQAGNLSEFDYYAANMNPFYFVVVDGSNVVQWISDQVVPSVIGFNDYEPATPVPVQTGWNVGMYFTSTGTIPYDASGADAWASANDSGMPTMGSTLSVTDVGGRTYSFVAASFANEQQKNDHHNKVKQQEDNNRMNGNHGGSSYGNGGQNNFAVSADVSGNNDSHGNNGGNSGSFSHNNNNGGGDSGSHGNHGGGGSGWHSGRGGR